MTNAIHVRLFYSATTFVAWIGIIIPNIDGFVTIDKNDTFW
jgi:hypothetical protein